MRKKEKGEERISLFLSQNRRKCRSFSLPRGEMEKRIGVIVNFYGEQLEKERGKRFTLLCSRRRKKKRRRGGDRRSDNGGG